jgi:hypothetical protein
MTKRRQEEPTFPRESGRWKIGAAIKELLLYGDTAIAKSMGRQGRGRKTGYSHLSLFYLPVCHQHLLTKLTQKRQNKDLGGCIP